MADIVDTTSVKGNAMLPRGNNSKNQIKESNESIFKDQINLTFHRMEIIWDRGFREDKNIDCKHDERTRTFYLHRLQNEGTKILNLM